MEDAILNKWWKTMETHQHDLEEMNYELDRLRCELLNEEIKVHRQLAELDEIREGLNNGKHRK